MHPALQLSEILRSIFEHLEDDEESLCSAMLVNRAWCIDATVVLWLAPPASALAALPADRRAHYAARLRSLTVPLTITAEAVAALAALHFPRLQRLELEYTPSLPVPFAGRCPALLALRTAWWLADDDGECRDIRALLHEHAGRLQDLETCVPLPPETLVRLARSSRLERLVMDRELLPAQVMAVVERVATPFRRLREFSGRTACALAPALLALVSAVESLQLHYLDAENVEQLPGAGGTAVAAAAAAAPTAASQLQELSLTLFSDSPLSKTPLLQLKNLSNLRSLWLNAYRHNGYLTGTELGDGDFVALVSGLPLLRVLAVNFAATWTVAAV
jgi:hypothetical protein